MRKDVLRELDRLHKLVSELQAANTGSSSSGAPTGAPYVTMAASGALTAERVLTAGTNITITDNGANSTVVIDAAGASVELIQDTVGAMVVAGTGITVAYNDGAGTETISCSITQYTDELAQDAVGGVVANSSTVSLTYVDATPSLTAAVIAGSIGTTQLADDGVTFAKLQNIATSRILGRDTAGSGDVEELTISAPFAIGDTVAGEFEFSEWPAESFYANPTGSDAQPVPVTPGPGLVWVGTSLEVYANTIPQQVVYEVDFNALGAATNLKTGGNGNKTIDGIVWELANEANATNFRYGSTYSGLQILCTTTTTTFNQTTQSSPYIRIPWANLVPNYNAAKDYTVQVRLTNWGAVAVSDAFYLGVWGAANGALAIGDIATIGPLGTTQTNMAASAGINRTAVPGPVAAGACDVVFSLAITGGKCRGFVDLWNSGWPMPGNAVGVMNEEGTTNSTSTMRDAICCIVLALRATSAAGTLTATVRGLRVIT